MASLDLNIKRKTIFNNIMTTRRASAFMRKSPGLRTLVVASTEENKKTLTDILQHKTTPSILGQDKVRLYVAFLASDKLAGGPFANYLDTHRKEKAMEYFILWEDIEILRCFATEGGRRGATAKSFGGNGFLSCHDEYPIQKDDPYHRYRESIKEIKKFADSWGDFSKKIQLLKDFLVENKISTPFCVTQLEKYNDQLVAMGVGDEILALVQDQCTFKLQKDIDDYIKFDAKNFYYYVSQKDEKFDFPEKDWVNRGLNIFLKRRKQNYHTTDTIRDTIFSPLSTRMWMALDICERIVFPFASRKLSMPLLTLNSIIKLKMFIARRRKKKMLAAQAKGKSKQFYNFAKSVVIMQQ